MLSDVERKILEFASKQLLITKNEIAVFLNRENYDGSEVSVNRLRSMGYLDSVESMGTCFVITQKGMRALKGEF